MAHCNIPATTRVEAKRTRWNTSIKMRYNDEKHDMFNFTKLAGKKHVYNAESKVDSWRSRPTLSPDSEQWITRIPTNYGERISNPPAAADLYASEKWSSGNNHIAYEDWKNFNGDIDQLLFNDYIKAQQYQFRKNEIIQQRYKARSILGKGSFGQVISAVGTNRTNQKMALKIFNTSEDGFESFSTERNLLEHIKWHGDSSQDLGRAHIVTIEESFMFGPAGRFPCIVMPLYWGTLSNWMSEINRNSEQPILRMQPRNQLREIVRQLMESLSFLSRMGIVHRNLKFENVLVKRFVPYLPQLVVVDFSIACKDDVPESGVCGTRGFQAPEMLLGLSYITPYDMWSAGAMVASMVLGFNPFNFETSLDSQTDQAMLQLIEQTIGTPPINIRKHLPYNDVDSLIDGGFLTRALIQIGCSEFASFLGRCLQWDPFVRMTPDEALSHSWLRYSSNSHPKDNSCCHHQHLVPFFHS